MEILIKTIDDNGNLASFKENASISLDKLSLSGKANQNLLRKLFELQSNREHYSVNQDVSIVPNIFLREKGYRYVADVYHQNEVSLRLAYSPNKDFISNDQLKIGISNHLLYQSNWVEKIDSILKSLRLECSVTELHIALDAPQIADSFLRLYFDSPLKLVREKLGGDIKNKRLSVTDSFTYNRRESDLYFSFYEKSLDYAEKSYIKDFHELNDVRGNVHRIEMRSRKISTLKTKGFDWKDLANSETLLQIFQSEFQNRIIFNDLNNFFYDKSRNKRYLRVNPIDFPATVSKLIQNIKTKPAIESMRSKKNTIKNLFMHTVKNPNQHNILALREMTSQNNLSGWFEAKHRSWSNSSLKTVEYIGSEIKRSLIDNRLTKLTVWKQKLLSKLLFIKFSEWNMVCVADETLL